MFRLSSFLRGLILIATLGVVSCVQAQAPVAAPPLSPAQSAFLKAEVQKAEDRFVARVAEICDTRRSTVRRALPAQGRITDPVSRMMAALERSLDKPLSEEQKAQIVDADAAYRKELEQAAVNARKR